MIYKEICLNDHTFLPEFCGKTAATLYVPSVSSEIDLSRRFPLVIVCPGGAYAFLSDREAEPVALDLVGSGIAALVLRYSVAPIRYPVQLLQVCASIALSRRMSSEWHIDPNNISVMGFSAGGHVAGCAGVLWEKPFVAETLGVEPHQIRPDSMLLCYAVTGSGISADGISINNLLGENPLRESVEAVELPSNVTSNTSPAFIWATADDGAVPIANSLNMASALSNAGIAFELHIYQSGTHGLSLCDLRSAAPSSEILIRPEITSWTDFCKKWIFRHVSK